MGPACMNLCVLCEWHMLEGGFVCARVCLCTCVSLCSFSLCGMAQEEETSPLRLQGMPNATDPVQRTPPSQPQSSTAHSHSQINKTTTETKRLTPVISPLHSLLDYSPNLLPSSLFDIGSYFRLGL